MVVKDVEHERSTEGVTLPAPAHERTDEPASGGRLLLGWALIVLAAVMLIVGWFALSDEPLVAAQLPYVVSGGIGGLLAGIVGVGLLVSNDIRRDRERLGRVEASLIEVRELLAVQSEVLEGLAERSRNGTARAPAKSKARGASRGGRDA